MDPPFETRLENQLSGDAFFPLRNTFGSFQKEFPEGDVIGETEVSGNFFPFDEGCLINLDLFLLVPSKFLEWCWCC